MPPPATRTLMFRQPWDVASRTRIGVQVIVIVLTTLKDDPSGAGPTLGTRRCRTTFGQICRR